MSPAKNKIVKKVSSVFRWMTNRQSRYLVLAVVVAVVLGIGGILYWQNSRPVINRQALAEAGFTVYAPRTTPAGYSIDDDQTNVRKNVLSYVLVDTSSDDKDITVTIQPKPDKFDMNKLIDKGSISASVTQNGTLYNLSAASTSQYLLDTGGSLVFITSPENIDTLKVNELVKSLQKIN